MKELSEAQRKLLESSEEGKLVLASIEAAKGELTQAKKEKDAAELERRELQAKLTDPGYLEALAGMGGKGRASVDEDDEPQASASGGDDDVNNIDLKTLVQRQREERKAEIAALAKELDSRYSKSLRSLALTQIKRELDDLRDDVGGEKFDARKDAFMKLSEEKPDLTPRRLWKELNRQEELAKVEAEQVKAKAEAEKVEAERKVFVENPAKAISEALATKQSVSSDDAFEAAWKATNAEAALKAVEDEQMKEVGG